MSWEDARQYCCQIGMDLVSINSADKVKYFTELAKSMYQYAPKKHPILVLPFQNTAEISCQNFGRQAMTFW